MFNVGDVVVYPAHGVAEIESISEREISGASIPFIILKILDTQMTVMVPVANAGNVGIRRLIDKKEIDQVMAILKQRDIHVDNQTWNRRYREYMEKIKSGSAREIAEVRMEAGERGRAWMDREERCYSAGWSDFIAFRTNEKPAT